MQDHDKKTLTKAEIVESLFYTIGLTKREAKDLVESFFNALTDYLSKGYMVKLPGFGNFIVRQKNERPGRNPKTGENVVISARKVVVFRPGQKLKHQIERRDES